MCYKYIMLYRESDDEDRFEIKSKEEVLDFLNDLESEGYEDKHIYDHIDDFEECSRGVLIIDLDVRNIVKPKKVRVVKEYKL